MDFFTIVRTNRGTIAWSDEQVAYITDEYINKGISLAELGRRFKCSPAALRYLIRKKGYQLYDGTFHDIRCYAITDDEYFSKEYQKKYMNNL